MRAPIRYCVVSLARPCNPCCAGGGVCPVPILVASRPHMLFSPPRLGTGPRILDFPFSLWQCTRPCARGLPSLNMLLGSLPTLLHCSEAVCLYVASSASRTQAHMHVGCQRARVVRPYSSVATVHASLACRALLCPRARLAQFNPMVLRVALHSTHVSVPNGAV